MSIDKLYAKIVGYIDKNQLPRDFSGYLSAGFWIIELLVSMAILSGIMLILFRFSCYIIVLQDNATKRLQAISYAYSLLEGQQGENALFYPKNSDFEVDISHKPLHIKKHNLPKELEANIQKNNFSQTTLIISWKTETGKKRNNNIKIITGKIKGVA